MHTWTVVIVEIFQKIFLSTHLTLVLPWWFKKHGLWYYVSPIVYAMSRGLSADGKAALERSTGVLSHPALQAGGST